MYPSECNEENHQIGRAVQQECRDRDLHSFPTRRSSDLGIITTIMATIQRINIIGSREGSRNRRRLKANQTGKKFRVGIKSNISTNRNNLISGVDRCIHLNAMKKTT